MCFNQTIPLLIVGVILVNSDLAKIASVGYTLDVADERTSVQPAPVLPQLR